MTDPERPVKPFPANSSQPCVYEEDLFTDFTRQQILAHDPADGPLLVFHAAHSIHTPLEVRSDFVFCSNLVAWYRSTCKPMAFWLTFRAGIRVAATAFPLVVLQVKEATYDRFDFIDYHDRRAYLAMVAEMDQVKWSGSGGGEIMRPR